MCLFVCLFVFNLEAFIYFPTSPVMDYVMITSGQLRNLAINSSSSTHIGGYMKSEQDKSTLHYIATGNLMEYKVSQTIAWFQKGRANLC